MELGEDCSNVVKINFEQEEVSLAKEKEPDTRVTKLGTVFSLKTTTHVLA